MIKLLWIICFIPIFIYTLKTCIKIELDDSSFELDPGLLFLFILISFLTACLGPLAILAYIGYTVLEEITKVINERYKK